MPAVSTSSKSLLTFGRDFLRLAGIESAAIDARVLLSEIVGSDARIFAGTISPAGVAKYKKFLARRSSGEPVAYIIGYREFYGLHFAVSSATLIPRPDSETLIEAARELLPADFAGDIADLGTGSGALLLSLLSLYKNARGVGVDLSPAAVSMARKNAKNLGLSATFKVADMRSFAPRKKFDVVISNPPYIKAADIPKLMRDVRNFEPESALVGGADGYDFYRAIAKLNILKPGGLLILEIGAGQAREVRRIFKAYRFAGAFSDLAGITRALAFTSS